MYQKAPILDRWRNIPIRLRTANGNFHRTSHPPERVPRLRDLLRDFLRQANCGFFAISFDVQINRCGLGGYAFRKLPVQVKGRFPTPRVQLRTDSFVGTVPDRAFCARGPILPKRGPFIAGEIPTSVGRLFS